MRERLLLGCLLIGAVLYAPVYALEQKSASSEAYAMALEDQAQARMAAQTARRISASASSQAAVEDMKTWGFSASNPAVAQVMIESRLVEAAETLGLPNPVITAQSKVEDEGPTQWMFADVQTDLRWGPALALIDNLGEWPEGFRMTSFRYEVMAIQNASDTTERGKIHMGFAFPVNLANPDIRAGTQNSRSGGQAR